MLRALPSYVLVLLLLLLAASTGTLRSQQPIPEVTANPNAAMLRRIWTLTGDGPNAGLGSGAGGVGDVNNDGIDDFAVFGVYGGSVEWRIYAGGSPAPSTEAIWSFPSEISSARRLIHGDFWGTGENCVAMASRYRDEQARFYYPIYVFRPEDGVLPTTPTETLDPFEDFDSLRYVIKDFFAADLDQDGDDELVALRGSSRAEIWIFEGGPEFGLSSPTRILREPEEHSFDVFAAVGDIDGDSYPDLLMSSDHWNDTATMSIWWGRNTLNGFPEGPDRVVVLHDSRWGLEARLVLADFDGDGVLDVVRSLFSENSQGERGIYLFRSRGHPDIRNRSFLVEEDADAAWPGGIVADGGHLNDSTGRFSMLMIPGARSRWYSGRMEGPDSAFDAYYNPSDDGIGGMSVQRETPLGDVSGNGWEDYLLADDYWGADQGIAIILEGGPYIPHDDPTVSVREVPVDDYADALHLWPNPVKDQLSLAWRGDLPTMPKQARIYDTRGQLVAEHQLNSAGRPGSAVLDCSALPVGSYLLQLSDEHRQQITTTQFFILR